MARYTAQVGVRYPHPSPSLYAEHSRPRFSLIHTVLTAKCYSRLERVLQITLVRRVDLTLLGYHNTDRFGPVLANRQLSPSR